MIGPGFGNAIDAALFMAACLVVTGIFAILGGTAWLIWYLCHHVSIAWVP